MEYSKSNFQLANKTTLIAVLATGLSLLSACSYKKGDSSANALQSGPGPQIIPSSIGTPGAPSSPNGATPEISHPTLSPEVVSLRTNEVFTFSATGGTPPYSYSVINGQGLMLPSGKFTAPVSTGETLVQVNDSKGHSSSGLVNIRNWVTVNDFRLALNGAWNYPRSLVTDRQDHILSSGEANSGSGGNQWIVRLSISHGLTWTTVDLFQLAPGKNASATHITVGHDGKFYAVGYAQDAGSVEHWIVRSSEDEGVHWSTIDDFQLSAGFKASASSIAVTQNGSEIAVIGYGNDASGKAHWITRKSLNTGSTWFTADDYQTTAGTETRGHSIIANASENLYGLGNDGHSLIVRKSVDGGSSWSDVDLFALPASHSCFNHNAGTDAIREDSKGNIYYVGLCMDSANVQNGIVRKLSAETQEWTTVLTEASFPHWSALFIDSNDAVYVLGRRYKDLAWGNMSILASRDEGLTFSALDTYQLQTGSDSEADAMTEDSEGNLHMVGFSWDGNGMHWLHRLFQR